MREYKFRGRRIDTGELVYGYLIGNDVIVGEIVEWDSEYFCTEFWYKVDSKTVGQYTGLRDNKRTKEYPNGQEIYEGDVTRRGETTYQIVWMENRAKFGAKVIRSECVLVRNLTFPLDHYVDEHDSLLEVIGNIYEYPELLAGRA
ncbi:YopX family protein [Paenibacillus ehimensis]|uniref:YopX family protein n=1 Tax=Paenibacillus ehimensis TaxID=79264 RepID=A0ABT8VMH0_9BACL|nr:YopX family protein [Paenibacillus ehimensis]MDO3682180.1 YopX family protein [Paenibacillus ehimensis]